MEKLVSFPAYLLTRNAEYHRCDVTLTGATMSVHYIDEKGKPAADIVRRRDVVKLQRYES